MNSLQQTKRDTLILTTVILVVSLALGYLFLDYKITSSTNKQISDTIQGKSMAPACMRTLGKPSL